MSHNSQSSPSKLSFSASLSWSSSSSSSTPSSPWFWKICRSFINVLSTHFLLKTVSPMLSYWISSVSSTESLGGDGFLSAIAQNRTRRVNFGNYRTVSAFPNWAEDQKDWGLDILQRKMADLDSSLFIQFCVLCRCFVEWLFVLTNCNSLWLTYRQMMGLRSQLEAV